MGIGDLFKKFSKGKKSSPEVEIGDGKYRAYVEAIDDNGLSRLFVESMTPELEEARARFGNDQYYHPLKTRISVADTEWLVKKFFSRISSSYHSKVCGFYDGTDPNVRIDIDSQSLVAKTSNPSKLPVTVTIPIRGNLSGLYEAVHEITHALDIANGDNPTRVVLGEVAPQCMERLLDTFLLEMSDNEMKKYGFDRKTIEKDIITRRLSTFFSRFNNAESLDEFVRTHNDPRAERKHPHGDRTEDSRYMLAQIYSTNLDNYRWDEKVARLKTFISCVENDDFYGANRSLGMQIYKGNDDERIKYIKSTIEAVESLIKPKQDIDDSTRGTGEFKSKQKGFDSDSER